MFLSDSLLDSIHQRADHYDRSNEFPELDYQASKKLANALYPKNGGHGLTLQEIRTGTNPPSTWHCPRY